jgi:Secretion system C-terminal sorting domain
MKKTLLTVLLLAAAGVSAQTVNTFYTISPNTYTYKLAESTTLLDESAAGENVSWDFSNLTEGGDSYTATTAATTTDFPTTNTLVETTGDFDATQFFLNNATGGGTYVTAVSSNGILLDYSTNNAFLGTFPKAYGAAATSDAVAGSFTYGENSGTFTGTCTTSVDGYGTLTTNVGTTPAGTPVTRLKIVQNLSLVSLGFPIGTVTQTMYSYYAASPADAPVFRTLTLVMNFPLLGVNNEASQSIESHNEPQVGTQQFTANNIAIAPNPVANVLHFTGDAQITKVTITDAAGRQVLQQAAANDVNVSGMSAGVYYVTAQTANGVATQKIVKQ